MNPGIIRSTARGARLAVERARFELWAKHLDARLRRAGGRLILDAPHGAHFHDLPRVEVLPYGDRPGAGSLTLRLGRDVHLGRGLILEIHAGAETVIELDDEVSFLAGVRVRVRSGAIRMGRHCGVRDYTFIDADGEIVMRRNAQIGRWAAIHAALLIDIGEDACIADRVSFYDSEHLHDGSDTPVYDQRAEVGPVRIASNVFIGANAIILHGVDIGPRSMIAAGSVVRAGEYPGEHLYAGAPAREIRPLQARQQAR